MLEWKSDGWKERKSGTHKNMPHNSAAIFMPSHTGPIHIVFRDEYTKRNRSLIVVFTKLLK